MDALNPNRPEQKLEYKFDFIRTMTFRRLNAAVNIDAQTNIVINVVLQGIENVTFYIIYFSSSIMVEDVGAAGRIVSKNNPELFTHVTIDTANVLAIGEYTGHTITANNLRTQMRIDGNETYDWYKTPILMPETNFNISLLVQAQQFVPVGNLECDYGFIISFGFIDKMNPDRIDIDVIEQARTAIL